MTEKVLVTGVSGWIAKHTTIELLNKGYEVLGTVRNNNLIDQTKETISKYAPIEKLKFIENHLIYQTKANKFQLRSHFANLWGTLPNLGILGANCLSLPWPGSHGYPTTDVQPRPYFAVANPKPIGSARPRKIRKYLQFCVHRKFEFCAHRNFRTFC